MDWRRLSIWILGGGVVFCGWCSLFSGLVGWWQGYELGYREAQSVFLPEVGVLVTRVDRNGPAAESGIVGGDTIIAINGVRIVDVPMLRAELMRYTPGQEIQLTYRQHMHEHTTLVPLGQFPGSNGVLPYLGIYYTARAEEPADV